jgi:glycerol transport system permease protein
MEKWVDNKGMASGDSGFLVVAFSAIVPLMTVVNYSIQDIFGPGNAVFVGTEWFEDMLARTTAARCPGTPVPVLGTGSAD